MAADTRLRALRNDSWLNEYERRSLGPVLTRLGKHLGEFQKRELVNLLSLIHNLPHHHRPDPEKSISALLVVEQILGTVRRYEIHKHTKDPAFRCDVAKAIARLQIHLNGLLAFVERGASVTPKQEEVLPHEGAPKDRSAAFGSTPRDGAIRGECEE